MDINEHVTQLQAHINALTATQDAMRQELADAKIDQWQARIDDLEVQVHLAALDTGDRIAPLMDDLRNIWLDARNQLEGTVGATKSARDGVRSSLETAYRDVRTAVLETRKLLSS